MNLPEIKQQLGFVRYYLVVILVIAGVFYAGHEFANKRNHLLVAKADLLQQSVDNLIEENQQINSRLNVKKVELEVASIANEKAQESIKGFMQIENELRQQISFYQKVMAPEMTQDGFVIENAEISTNASTNNYTIKLMMLQHENIKAVIKGTLNIRLFGSLNGNPVSYNITDLLEDKEQSLAFSFKYFEVMDIRVTLPENFEPERLAISTDVYKYRRKRGSYNTEISWETAFAE
ncbi:DUF6776 family protein [Glaciecola sp. KUL10]|uniref:DUF6776 family protein n=1 Tax=Glaciecola sp. (strain KUL10) TaxID=2161813 RepID=UPI000D78C409|nr:DUF6776 family protein [Glaciecola sp. KUL10]GBL03806.1 hypothetical protein KUL10_11060 [Glaciecola sp. KUL10]